jgi:hypothetical protein
MKLCDPIGIISCDPSCDTIALGMGTILSMLALSMVDAFLKYCKAAGCAPLNKCTSPFFFLPRLVRTTVPCLMRARACITTCS